MVFFALPSIPLVPRAPHGLLTQPLGLLFLFLTPSPSVPFFSVLGRLLTSLLLSFV